MSKPQPPKTPDEPAPPADAAARPASGPGAARAGQRPREIGGRDGPEPTRYGDWEKAGRAVDF